ncbi:hypothetical protein HG530_001197 [Fusarium avenaceum]|nr:hypothetical protein HG530_001197 [Fusarium avenaceum]
MPHSILSSQGQPICIWASDKNTLSPQRNRLHDIRATSDTTIEEDVELVTDGIDDSWKHTQTAYTTVLLSAAVVAYHYSLDTSLDALSGVGNTLDALQDDGPVPMLLQKFNVLPRMGMSGKHDLGPLAGRGAETASC